MENVVVRRFVVGYQRSAICKGAVVREHRAIICDLGYYRELY